MDKPELLATIQLYVPSVYLKSIQIELDRQVKDLVYIMLFNILKSIVEYTPDDGSWAATK